MSQAMRSTESLPLGSVMIGCSTHYSYQKLTEAICGTVIPTPTTPSTSPISHRTVNPSESHERNSHGPQSHLFMLGGILSTVSSGKTVFERGKAVPPEFISACRLEGADDIRTTLTVVSTSPFCKGHMDVKTELVILKMPNSFRFPSPSESCGPPMVSDFLTAYSHSSSTPSSSKSVIDVEILDGNVSTLVDIQGNQLESDHTVFIDTAFAHDFGVMNDGFVLVKLEDGQKRISRHMKVSVLPGDSMQRVQLSQITLFNLGGSELTSKRLLSIKRTGSKKSSKVQSDNQMYTSASSASLLELNDEISLAKQVTVCRVHQSDHPATDLPTTESLMDYFTKDRYFCVGDVFVLTLSPHDRQSDTKLLMKIVKINKSNQTTATYRVNRQTTLFEGTPVHSFIPSCVSKNEIKISRAFSSLRESLVTLLKSFIQHKWNPSPLPFLLLAGDEGCGKSLLAKQVARLFQCNYIEVNCVHLVADTVNTTETRIRDLLQRAQAVAPTLLMLRNIDTLTKEEPMNIENPRLSQAFQNEMTDTLEQSDWPIIIFGSCDKLNRVSEGIRESAIHEIIVQAPDVEERCHILEDLCDRHHLNTDVSLKHFSEHTAGFLYGDLKALVSHAQRNSYTRASALGKEELGYVDDELVKSSQILMTDEDFQKGLETLQSLQSLDLGAPKIPNVKWSDIGGLERVKEDILDTIQLPLRHPELFISTMRRSGVLLYGPPGTGKTLLAKAVATECALNFFSVKGPELINMYVGQSEENIRQVFHKARSASPCVIFFDELDSLAPNRGRSGDSGGVMDRVVSQLLAELDGLVKSCDVFVIGATNRPDLLDPALLRPGRFDKLVYVGICSSSVEQLTILRAITRKFDLDADCDLHEVSERCYTNMTGADLYSLCAEAMTNAIKRQIDRVEAGEDVTNCKVSVNMDDFMRAIEQTTPSLGDEEIQRYEQVRLHFTQQGNNVQTRQEINVQPDVQGDTTLDVLSSAEIISSNEQNDTDGTLSSAKSSKRKNRKKKT